MIFSKELEKLADEYCDKMGLFSRGNSWEAYIQGAAALENLIMKSGSEFDEDELWDSFPGDPKFWNEHLEAARWQHSQSQLIIGGLRQAILDYTSKICDMEEYIEQLEKASDTQSNQYHQMREKYESMIEVMEAQQDKLAGENRELKEKLGIARKMIEHHLLVSNDKNVGSLRSAIKTLQKIGDTNETR